jgi:hypothetical protein
LPVALVTIGWTTGARRRCGHPGGAGAPPPLSWCCADGDRDVVSLALGIALARLRWCSRLRARRAAAAQLSTDRPLDPAHVPAWLVIGLAVAAAIAAVIRGWPARLPAAIAGLVWWAVLVAPAAVAILATRGVGPLSLRAAVRRGDRAGRAAAALVAGGRRCAGCGRRRGGVGALCAFATWQQWPCGAMTCPR